jgi:hypothetical protein
VLPSPKSQLQDVPLLPYTLLLFVNRTVVFKGTLVPEGVKAAARPPTLISLTAGELDE